MLCAPMARPDRESNRRSKSVVRKIVSEHLGDFDEQVWPVNLAILVFAGFVTGIVLAATEDFFDPRPFYNGFVRLGVVAVLVVILLASTTWLKAPTARRVQFCVILSLFLHMVLAVFLREQYLKLVAFLREQTIQAMVEEDIITVPDYVEDSFEEPGTLSEYEQPAKVVPSERDAATEIAPESPRVPSSDEIVPQSRSENSLPERAAPVPPQRHSLQTPERVREEQPSPIRQPDRDSAVMAETATLQPPIDLQPSRPPEIGPQDQVVRESRVSEPLLQQRQSSAVDLSAPENLPRTTIERNPETRLTNVPRRQPFASQSLSSIRPEIAQIPMGGVTSPRELEPANRPVSQQTTSAPLVTAADRLPAEQLWTPPGQSPALRDGTPRIDTVAQAGASRRTAPHRPDALKSIAQWDASLPEAPSSSIQSGPSQSLEARETNLAPSATGFNSASGALNLGVQTADSPSAMAAAIAQDYGMSRLGQAPGTSTGRGEGETLGSGFDTTLTQPQGIRASGRSPGLPSLVSPELNNVGSGGPVGGIAESSSSQFGTLGDKLAVGRSSDGTGQAPLLGTHSVVDGEFDAVASGQGLRGTFGPTVSGIVRRSIDEAAIMGNLSVASGGTALGRGRQPGGSRLPGESSAEMSGGAGSPVSPGTEGVAGASQQQGGPGGDGLLQNGLSGTSQRGTEIAAAAEGGQPRLLGSHGENDTGYLTSSLLAGTTPGGGGRPERLSLTPVVVGGAGPGRTAGRQQLTGVADLDPAEAFRQRSPSQRGATAAQYGGTPETEAAVERGLAFLAKIQFADGHWSLNRLPQPLPGDEKTFGLAEMHGDTAATAMSLLAFLGAGYTHQEPKYKDTVGRGLRWIIRNQLNNGQLFRSETDPTLYTQFYGHGLATIALCEAYGMTKDPALREPAEKAIGYILRSQSPEFGGWRYVPRKETDTSVTGWQLMALKSAQMAGLSVPGDAFQGVARWLDRAQVDNGARYVYNPFAGQTASQSHLRLPNRAMTAEGLLMRIYLGWQQDTPALRQGAEFLKQNLPAYDPSSLESRDCYYWYYATQVMFQMQGELWQVWNRQVQETLLKNQVQTGPWAGSWDPLQPVADRWGKEAGRLYVTAFHLLILEVYYRHLPLFKTLAE